MSFVKTVLLGCIFLLFVQLKLNAQQYGALGGSGSYSRPGNNKAKDSLEKRDQNADSITIFYKF